MKVLTQGLLIGVAVAMSACGGSSSNDAPANVPPSIEVPADASASTGGLVTYLATLNVTDAEDREPVGIVAFNPQQPDDTEPQALN